MQTLEVSGVWQILVCFTKICTEIWVCWKSGGSWHPLFVQGSRGVSWRDDWSHCHRSCGSGLATTTRGNDSSWQQIHFHDSLDGLGTPSRPLRWWVLHLQGRQGSENAVVFWNRLQSVAHHRECSCGRLKKEPNPSLSSWTIFSCTFWFFPKWWQNGRGDYRPSFVLGQTVKRWRACTESTIQANTFDALHLTPVPLLEVPCFRDDAVLEKVEFRGMSLKTTCRYAYYANPKCQTPSGQWVAALSHVRYRVRGCRKKPAFLTQSRLQELLFFFDARSIANQRRWLCLRFAEPEAKLSGIWQSGYLGQGLCFVSWDLGKQVQDQARHAEKCTAIYNHQSVES